MSDPRTTITSVEARAGQELRLTFADGEVHDVDLSAILELGGVFDPVLRNRAVFEAVGLDDFGAVSWPGGVDLDPVVLRGDESPASGVAVPRRVVRRALVASE